MGRHSYRYKFYLPLLLLVLGCGFRIPTRPIEITIVKGQNFRPLKPADIKNKDQAMQAIITACEESLGLPTVDPLHLKLYKNSASMGFYGRGWSTLPMDVENQIAFTQDNTIHVNLEAVPKQPFGLVKVLAHEYAHAIENSLTGNEPLRSNWLTEGFAEWFAAKILNSLNWQNYDTVLESTREELFVNENIVPRIDTFHLDKDWQFFLSRPKGYISTYKLALVAVDRLVTTRGMSAVTDYARNGDFEHSFGLSVHDFSSDLAEFIRKSRQSGPKQVITTKPSWSVGDRWTYVKKEPGRTVTVTKQVIREDMLDRMPIFVVQTTNGEILYSKETLGAVGATKSGRLIFSTNEAPQDFLWPLETGKSWKNIISVKDVFNNSTSKEERLMLVKGNEEIRVRAGTFDAVRIEAFDFNDGIMVAEYWYSARAKWLIKSRTFSNADGIDEEELAEFSVK